MRISAQVKAMLKWSFPRLDAKKVGFEADTWNGGRIVDCGEYKGEIIARERSHF